MTTNPNCAVESLAIYVPSSEKPWEINRIQHLYRRLGYGAEIAKIGAAQTKSPSRLVDELIEGAMTARLPNTPEWATWDFPKFEQKASSEEEREDLINEAIYGWLRTWIKDMMAQGVRGKMVLFWHNHFVTQLETFYFPRYLYDYHRLLQEMAFGNFKEFVSEMGKNTAMLFFLNGVESNKYEPNENYARELYELFTLGRDNSYTQTDIEETARALTGWNNLASWGSPITFNDFLWDKREKTIFGQTGTWGYNDVHDILFEERKDQIARFICQKIYTHFVNPLPNEFIINQLADTFKNNDWKIAPVMKQLFKSEHFFDEKNIGVLVKSPYDLFLNFFQEVGGYEPDEEGLGGLHYFTGMLGQELSSPIDVAGWRGNRSWIDTARITGRWRIMGWIIYGVMDQQPEKLTELAIQLVGSQGENDPALVTQKVVDFFLAAELHTPEIYERATEVFKVEIPSNYFDDGQWNLYWDTIPWQMTSLLQYLAKIPEFQLT
ncbi:MAG: DUF1800 domain-containing protein [Bacteroidota bacterium]